MKLTGLSFDALPPIDIPFRYFLTAPIFALLSAIIVLIYGEVIWMSRWHPTTILLTHSFTLGFITMVMMGALYQILPVVGGVGVSRVRFVGAICHALLFIGTFALMSHFVYQQYWLKVSAFIALGLCFCLYILAISLVLIKRLSQGDTIVGIRLAIAALFFTVCLGLLMLGRTIGVEFLSSSKSYTDIHMLWGLGWVSLLIISVSFQVVPMFHVAPNFPRWIMKLIPVGIFILLVSLLMLTPSSKVILTVAGGVLLLHCIYVWSLISILRQRKRKIPDTTIKFWQLAAYTIFVISGFSIVPIEFLPKYLTQKYSLLIGASFIYFFILSVLIGMLLKIMPFLSYTHLQQKCLMNFTAMEYLPNMHDFINKSQGNKLFVMHVVSGISLLVTIIFPYLYYIFSFALFVEFSWLFFLMLKTMNIYYKSAKKIQLASQ
ncbi:MAG: hypothetical protein KC484_11650 [Colwelliaceae bacterium]|nr:hypothetical protein [Colwelliaceae bacterium]